MKQSESFSLKQIKMSVTTDRLSVCTQHSTSAVTNDSRAAGRFNGLVVLGQRGKHAGGISIKTILHGSSFNRHDCE